MKPNDILIAQDNIFRGKCIKRFLVFNNRDQFLEYAKNDHHLYEIISSNNEKKCKVVFDIDIDKSKIQQDTYDEEIQ